MITLLFCKSAVTVHPSSNPSDFIAGFLLISKDHEATPNQDAVLSWIPEYDLDEEYISELKRLELKLLESDKQKLPKDFSLRAIYSSWSFSSKLSAIYSIQFRPPHPNGYWEGSCSIHLRTECGDDGDIPILFFDDRQCPSTQSRHKQLNKMFDPFSSEGNIYWGGDDLKKCLEDLVDLKPASLDLYIYLVNASLEDLRNFSVNRPANIPSRNTESSLWKSLESTRWTLLSKFADITTAAGNTVGTLIKKHPIVQLIGKHNSNPYVKQLMNNPRVKEVHDDFDSAKIYLAKWAMGVKHEAERYQKLHHLDETYKTILINELGITDDVSLSAEEVNAATQRSFPLTKQKWDSLFDAQGRLSITVHEVKDYIFHGGVEDDQLRKEVWLFLLGVYPWESSREEREEIKQSSEESYYANFKSKWQYREPFKDTEEEEYWNDQVFRIEKDVKRNDRDISVYKYNTSSGKPPSGDSDAEADGLENYIEQEEDEQWKIKNPHLNSLRSILISYNLYNNNLGYVQGMTDLLSPIYYILQDEAMSFWCFVNFMERMERNFLRDQSGIRDQMICMVDLCQFMLPRFAEHLNKCDSSNLFFCFRMLIVWFKREFSFKDICSIWEIFWTDYYSSQWQLFFLLAILHKHSGAVMSQLSEFDEVLKYFNDLRNSMDWSDVMIRSELLFLKFQKMVDLLERQRLLGETTGSSNVQIHLQDETDDPPLEHPSLISDSLKGLLSRSILVSKESPRFKNSIK